MPTYEYACRSCERHLEVAQSFSDPPLSECPSCGGSLRKVFGAVGIAFKGSGFYRTDSRADGKRGRTAAGGDRADSGKGDTTDASSSASASSSSPSSSGGEAKSA